MGAVPDDELGWSPTVWTAGHAEVFARFRELSNEAVVLSEEVRAFLDASRVQDAGLNILDFGGGTGDSVDLCDSKRRLPSRRLGSGHARVTTRARGPRAPRAP